MTHWNSTSMCMCAILWQMLNNGIARNTNDTKLFFLSFLVKSCCSKQPKPIYFMYLLAVCIFIFDEKRKILMKNSTELTLSHTLPIVFHVAMECNNTQHWILHMYGKHGLIIKPNHHVVLMTHSNDFDVIAIVLALTPLSTYNQTNTHTHNMYSKHCTLCV